MPKMEMYEGNKSQDTKGVFSPFEVHIRLK